jgi:poly-gamma-glutamate capsule biosynthesis protein CapA/YwtB (metallophosphatase superfamily)
MAQHLPSFRYLVLMGSLLAIVLTGCNASSAPTVQVAPPAPRPDSIVSVRIAAVGDLMCHAPQFTNAKVAADSFDFRPCFAEIQQVLQDADFTIGNLETVFAGAAVGYKGYPNFNTPDAYLQALQVAGFDFLVTANNHSLDQGEKGVLRTLDKLDAAQMPHTGTHRNQRDRDSVRVVDIQGITIAITNFTYGMNGYKCPAGKEWMVNVIDTALIEKDIAAAKALKPDLVLAFFHWGNEYEHEPNAYQKAAASVAIQAGADLIIGSHPHVLQPVELFKTVGGRLDSGLVVWSLGNFFSNQVNRYTDAGAVLQFELSKNLTTSEVTLGAIQYVPTWVYRGLNPVKKLHIILPAEIALADTLPHAYLTAESHTKMKQAWKDTELYINKYRSLELLPMEKWAKPSGSGLSR